MTDEEQKKVFAKNLNYLIALNQKQQVEVAKDLDINATTLNNWCKGLAMPYPGKLRVLAEYFNVGITALTDSAEDIDIQYSNSMLKIGKNDERFKKIVIAYQKLSEDKKRVLCDFLETFVL